MAKLSCRIDPASTKFGKGRVWKWTPLKGTKTIAPAEAGDAWTWTAIDAESKLLVSWLVGQRNTDSALRFVDDLKSRLSNRVQLTSDGHRPYLQAVDTVFGNDVDYAMLHKIYGSEPHGEKRYSPAVCIGAQKRKITGNRKAKHISTSYAERTNLTKRDAHAPLHSTHQRIF